MMRALLAILALALPLPGFATAGGAAGSPVEALPPAQKPQPLVKRGEPVLIAVRSGGLLITSQGRALASANQGEPVRVISTATHRTLEGVVDGPGSVRIPLN